VDGKQVRPVRLEQEGDAANYWSGSIDVGDQTITDEGYMGHEGPGGTFGKMRFAEAILLDEDFNTIIQTPIRLPNHLIPRFEDCRIMFIKGKPHLYTSNYFPESDNDPRPFIGRATDLSSTLRPMKFRLRSTKTGSVKMADFVVAEAGSPATIVIEDLTPVKTLAPKPPTGKNHAFFEHGNDLYLLDQFFPRRIWRIMGEQRIDYIHSSQEIKGNFLKDITMTDSNHYHLSGGKLVSVPQTREYLGMIHIHRDYDDRSGFWGEHYTQAFFTLSGSYPFDVLRVSPEFCFQSHLREDDCEAVQFSPNIELDGNVLVISYGAMDLEAMVVTVDIARVLKMLKPIPADADGFKKILQTPKDLAISGTPFGSPDDVTPFREQTKFVLPPEQKVFAIGFGGMATATLHEVFRINGCPSQHSRLEWDIDLWQCFTAGYERDVEELYNRYPKSVFILQTRKLRPWLRTVMVRALINNKELPHKEIVDRTRNAILAEVTYFETVLRFFQDKPKANLIVVSVDQPDWIRFLCQALKLKTHDVDWLNESPKDMARSSEIEKALDEALTAEGIEKDQSNDFFPRSLVPLLSDFQHNMPFQHITSPAPASSIILDTGKDFGPEQGKKWLYYEYNEGKRTGDDNNPFKFGEWKKCSYHADKLTYTAYDDAEYPYISRHFVHPGVVGKGEPVLVAYAWRPKREYGPVVIKASVKLKDLNPDGDGVQAFIEVNGKRLGQFQMLDPKESTASMMVRATVKKDSTVRLILGPKSQQHYDTVIARLVISKAPAASVAVAQRRTLEALEESV